MCMRHIEKDVMNMKMNDKNIFVHNKQLESKEKERVEKKKKRLLKGK